ncbi:MAG: hypothetical protein ACKVP7_24135 [Hyphomicrobiaceae bacterium]
MAGVTLTVLLRVPLAGVAEFQAYEALVLPLVGAHGGAVQRRLRNADGTVECHVVWFPSHAAFESFRNDPRRAAAAPRLAASGAKAELFDMTDVEPIS